MQSFLQKWRGDPPPHDLTRPFAFDFYQRLHSDSPQNLIFSPFSIWLALAMVYAGARGNTASQLAMALHLAQSHAELHPMVAALTAEIARRQHPMEGIPPEMNIANRLWGQQGLPFEPAYLELLHEFYGGDLAQTDFSGGSLAAIADEINGWVAHQTRDKITHLLSPNLLSPLTRLILVNAIYFKGRWQHPFDENITHDAPFYLLDGTTTRVRMMYQKEELPFVIEDDYAAVQLPYQGGDLAMLLILPAEGHFKQFDFNPALFQTLTHMQAAEKVAIYLPRFEMSTALSLKDDLLALGIHDAFDAEAADFSGMAQVPKAENLYIAAGVHQAHIKVDESGTEAAAATAIVMQVAGMMPKPQPIIRFDHPFIYAIYDQRTGTILFMGRVMNPAE